MSHGYSEARGLTLPEQRVAWDLRKHWATQVEVRVTLTPACLIRTIVGNVEAVAATGAYAVIDGWHVPCESVEAIGKPTYIDRETYQREMRSERLRQALNPTVEGAA